jgi:diadenosine tetraphosphate (Ap4A) HIT family hydrolase
MKKEQGCPFCNIDLKRTRILDETKNTFVLISNPVLVPSHLLVIPKRHVGKLSELNKEELNELVSQVIKFQEKLVKKFTGCDLRQNYRPFQRDDDLKVEHLHINLQPREFNDDLYLKCQINEKDIFRMLNQDELNKIQKELK